MPFYKLNMYKSLLHPTSQAPTTILTCNYSIYTNTIYVELVMLVCSSTDSALILNSLYNNQSVIVHSYVISCAACIQEFHCASPRPDHLDLRAFMAVMVSPQYTFLLPLVLWNSNCTIGWTGWNYMYTYVCTVLSDYVRKSDMIEIRSHQLEDSHVLLAFAYLF